MSSLFVYGHDTLVGISMDWMLYYITFIHDLSTFYQLEIKSPQN